MTIDEAICHSEEVAEQNEELYAMHCKMGVVGEPKCKKCAEEHRQLAEWLKDYKRLLNKEKSGQWLKDELGFYCSECGRYAIKDNCLMQLRTEFCPHCGADLRSNK